MTQGTNESRRNKWIHIFAPSVLFFSFIFMLVLSLLSIEHWSNRLAW